MGLFMWGALAAVVAGAALGGGGSPANPAERGFAFVDDCTRLEVADEAKALAWVRKRVAEMPPGQWETAFVVEVTGPCMAKLQEPATLSKFLPQLPFLWRLALHALAGAVDSKKITRDEAELRIKNVLDKAASWGIDPALLTPTTLPQ